MSKYHLDQLLPPPKWEQQDDAETHWQNKMRQARETPASGIKVGKSLETNLPFFITPRQLSTHMQVVGSTGLGKSYFLEGITKSLILQGRGVCVIDPHGDLYH